MTEAATVETTAEPVPPVPEAVVEVETAAPEQADATAPAENRDQRSLAFDVEHLGVLRRAVLDALLDADEPLSVSRILAEMPVGTSRGNAESAIKREFDQGRIMRTSPGHYALAPARAEPPKPAPSPDPPAVRSDGMTDQMWFDALEAWHVNPSTWNVVELGPPPNQSGCLVPLGVISKHNDRVRKRLERQRDREAAQARQAAADRELRTVLLRACNGNYSASLEADDLAPVREVLKVLPLDRVVMVVRQKVDRRCYPANPPLSSWRDQSFLRALAEEFCRAFAVPGLVREWGAAGKVAAAKAQSSPPAGDMPDDPDDLRSHHDNPSAPPGPHSLAQPDATLGALEKPADASEAPAAVSAPPRTANRTGSTTGTV